MLQQSFRDQLLNYHKGVSAWVRSWLEMRNFQICEPPVPDQQMADSVHLVLLDMPDGKLYFRAVTGPDDLRPALLLGGGPKAVEVAVGIAEVFLAEYYEDFPAERGFTEYGLPYRASSEPIPLYVRGDTAQAAALLLKQRYTPALASEEWRCLHGPSEYIR